MMRLYIDEEGFAELVDESDGEEIVWDGADDDDFDPDDFDSSDEILDYLISKNFIDSHDDVTEIVDEQTGIHETITLKGEDDDEDSDDDELEEIDDD